MSAHAVSSGPHNMETTNSPFVTKITAIWRWFQTRKQSSRAAQNLVAMKWDTTYSHGGCIHTEEQWHPWLEYNSNFLKDNEKDKFFVTYVILMNRGDCCGDRLSPYEISVDGKVCGGKQRRIGQGATSLLWCGLEGTRVRISLPRKGILTLCGLEILGTRLWECGNLRRGQSRPRARQMLAGGFLCDSSRVSSRQFPFAGNWQLLSSSIISQTCCGSNICKPSTCFVDVSVKIPRCFKATRLCALLGTWCTNLVQDPWSGGPCTARPMNFIMRAGARKTCCSFFSTCFPCARMHGFREETAKLSKTKASGKFLNIVRLKTISKQEQFWAVLILSRRFICSSMPGWYLHSHLLCAGLGTRAAEVGGAVKMISILVSLVWLCVVHHPGPSGWSSYSRITPDASNHWWWPCPNSCRSSVDFEFALWGLIPEKINAEAKVGPKTWLLYLSWSAFTKLNWSLQRH